MSYDDFCRLEFDEFTAIYNAYIINCDTLLKNEWNQLRTLACIMIQPHLAKGKKITPEKLLPLPWDKEKNKQKTANEVAKLTREERIERMKNLVAKLGETI